MFKNVLFANPELKSFLKDQQYDTLIIEEIRWRTDTMGRCEPVIVARAAGSLAAAAAYAALVHQQYLKVTFKNRNADKGDERIGTRIQRIERMNADLKTGTRLSGYVVKRLNG